MYAARKIVNEKWRSHHLNLPILSKVRFPGGLPVSWSLLAILRVISISSSGRITLEVQEDFVWSNFWFHFLTVCGGLPLALKQKSNHKVAVQLQFNGVSPFFYPKLLELPEIPGVIGVWNSLCNPLRWRRRKESIGGNV